MTYLGPARASEFHSHSHVPFARSRRAVAVLGGLLVATILLLVGFLPSPLVLPAFGVVSLAGAAIAALLAWCTGANRDADIVTLWDIAGALAFIGFAATMLSDPEHVLELMH